MSTTNYALRPNSELDAFLFATVGDDEKGTSVSVLSALVRLNFDPWQQAQELAQLPRGDAQRQLSSIIASLGGMSAAKGQPGPIAERLVSLLPKAGRPIGAPRDLPGHTSAKTPPGSSRALFGWLAVIALIILGQALWSTRSQSLPPYAAPAETVSTGVTVR